MLVTSDTSFSSKLMTSATPETLSRSRFSTTTLWGESSTLLKSSFFITTAPFSIHYTIWARGAGYVTFLFDLLVEQAGFVFAHVLRRLQHLHF